jgi:hypothetical protein
MSIEMNFKPVFQAADGTLHNSKQELIDYMRKPAILAALMTLTQGNEDLSQWLLASEEEVLGVFGTGSIKRVTKSERNKLRKGFDKLAELHAGENAFAFMLEHAEAIITGFKWPGQTRLVGEAKVAAITETLMSITNGNADLVNWIVANEEQIKNCFEAGKIKREVPEKTRLALAEFQAKRAAEKAAREAAAAAEATPAE